MFAYARVGLKEIPEHGMEQTDNCTAMTNHRNSVNIQIKGSDSQYLTECTRDPSMRVMLFCATDNHGVQEIAFPHQSELKVNGGEIKANLRGLKNKPGSTRPVDVTDHLRLKIPGYTNNVEFTYALTTKAGATKIQVRRYSAHR